MSKKYTNSWYRKKELQIRDELNEHFKNWPHYSVLDELVDEILDKKFSKKDDEDEPSNKTNNG